MEMKKAVSGLMGTVLVSGLLMLPASSFSQATSGVTPPASTQPQTGAKHEHHPELRKALKALNRAKMALEHASHDFAGHREQALDLVNKAIEQCKEALQSDKK